VVVAGLDVPGAESRIREVLAGLESNPRFVIQPLLRVSVGGEVRQPSLYTLPPETSIAEAVALAGGATERGRMDRVRLFRDGAEFRVDLTEPQGGLAQAPIRSGDQIFVQRRVSVFRDYIAPAGSITAALASIISLALR
jgi:protein involved in polysaccharide export with SLBB domain